MYIIYKFCFASSGNCRERYNESFKPPTNCNSVIPGQQGTNVWHGVEINQRINKKCSKFNEVQKTSSPTKTKPSSKNISSCLNKSDKSKNNLNANINYAYNTHTSTRTTTKNNLNKEEPEYDISFKFNTKTTEKSKDTDFNNLRSNPLNRGGSIKSFDSSGSASVNICQSSHSNLINCIICRTHFAENLCKLPLQQHNDCINHHYNYHERSVAGATAAAVAANAEDNNKNYTMILSRSCKPLKFSFASEWLV